MSFLFKDMFYGTIYKLKILFIRFKYDYSSVNINILIEMTIKCILYKHNACDNLFIIRKNTSTKSGWHQMLPRYKIENTFNLILCYCY